MRHAKRIVGGVTFLVSLAVFVALMPSSAARAGTTNVWIGTGESANFSTAANWAGGTVPVVNADAGGWASTNAVFQFTNELDYVQQVTYDSPQPSYWNGIVVGLPESDPYHILWTYARAHNNYITTYDASGFQGRVMPQKSLGGWHLLIESNSVSRIPSLFSAYDMTLIARSVAKGDTGSAEVGALWGRGRMTIGSPHHGTANYPYQKPITIADSQQGLAGNVYVQPNGNLYIAGRAETEPKPVAGAWLHLDASKPTTLTVEDGRVTAWRDADGGSVVATVHASAAAPYYVENAVNGRASVSFGAFKGPENGNKAKRAATFGEAGALTLSASTSAARELFVVFRDNEPNASAPFFTGTDSGYGFDRYAGERYLFSSNPTNKALAVADVRVDGTRMLPNEQNDFSHGYHVVSCGLKGTGGVAAIATDCQKRFGGLSIAELYVYTTELTARERRAMNLYLRRKWLGADAGIDYDFDMVSMAAPNGASSSLSVTGGTARIRTLDLYSSATGYTKSGNGTLVVDRIASSRSDLNLTVNAGAIRFEDGFADEASVRDDAPAADPVLWLDAACDSSLVKSNGTDAVYVTKWNDRRDGTNYLGTTVYADLYAQAAGRLSAPAKIVDNTPTGKPALDFGEYGAVTGWGDGVRTTVGFGICMGDSYWSGYVYREVFEVIERTTDNTVAYIGNWGSINGSTSALYDGGGNCDLPLSDASATINGKDVVPTTQRTAKNSYDVVRVSANARFRMNGSLLINDSQCAGGFRLAEMVAYDRVLTDEERRNTEAYLLRKWRNEAHPALAAQSLGTLTFASGVKNQLGTDRDLTVAAISGQATNVTFTGKGQVTVTGSLPADYDSIDVGGNVFAGPTKIAALFADCDRHFDASDAGAMTTETDPNGGTWVTKWLDVRRNGLCAAWYAQDGIANNTNKPWLVTATIGGVARQVVDFGEFCMKARGDASAATLASTNTATGFRLYKDTAATSGHWDGGYNEFYVVRRDRPGETKFPPLLNCWDCTARDETTGQLFNGGGYYNNSNLRCLTMDGTNVSNTACVTDRDWHLFVFGTKSSGVAWRALGKDWARPNNGDFILGGWQCAEVIGFKRPLGPERRRLLTEYLMKKWFNKTPDYSRHYDSVTMNGGGVTLTGDFTNTVAATFGGRGVYAGPDVSGVRNLLIGGTSAGDVGTLSVTTNLDLSAVTSLTFDFASATEYDRVVSTAALTLPAAALVVINLPANLKLKGDFYPLVSAGTLLGDISSWSLAVSGGNPSRQYRLERHGDAVGLRVYPHGIFLLVQ